MGRHRHSYDMIEELQHEFYNWLGDSNYAHGMPNIPASRFSNTSANGLWEYSPFLCGVGLMEGLELAYLVGMKTWDQITEPLLLMHLHNMLVQKGYLQQPGGLYASLQTFFQSAFFVDGKVPTSDFRQALMALIGKPSSRPATQKRATARAAEVSATDIHHCLTPDANRFFRLKSNLVLYRQSDWNAARISDADIPVASMLGTLRLGETKQTVDPATGRKRPEETDLVKRARAECWSDEALLRISSSWGQHRRSTEDSSRALLDSLAPLEKSILIHFNSNSTKKATTPAQGSANNNGEDDHHHGGLTGRDLLALLKTDISRDVCGDTNPLSSLNYVWVTAKFIALFMVMEKELAELRNPLYVRAYETGGREEKEQKRARLVLLALAEQDDECLKVMARLFDRGRSEFGNHIYWIGLETCEEREEKGRQGVENVD